MRKKRKFNSLSYVYLIWQSGKFTVRPKNFLKLAQLVLFLVMFSIITPKVLLAQNKEATRISPGIKAFYIVASPVAQLGSSVNGGGSLSINSLFIDGGLHYQINEKCGIGLGLFWSGQDYRFSGVNAIPLADPWDTVLGYGFGIPLTYAISNQWLVVVAPVGQFSGESGANWGSSLIYGGFGSLTYLFGKASYIGIGIGGFHNIGETEIFPYINLNWHVTDRWRLSNTLQSSPVGPAGLQISYGLTQNLEIGVGAGYRFSRFRLDKNGQLPNGIGQYSQIPVVANITYTHSLFSMTAYGGVALDNKIWIEQSNGDGIYRADQRPAPLVGINLTIGAEPTQFRALPWQIRQFRYFYR